MLRQQNKCLRSWASPKSNKNYRPCRLRFCSVRGKGRLIQFRLLISSTRRSSFLIQTELRWKLTWALPRTKVKFNDHLTLWVDNHKTNREPLFKISSQNLLPDFPSRAPKRRASRKTCTRSRWMRLTWSAMIRGSSCAREKACKTFTVKATTSILSKLDLIISR